MVSWPIIPNTEFININKEAAVIICFGLATLIINRIGLRKIPPPIPTIPEIKPKMAPIITDTKYGILL